MIYDIMFLRALVPDPVFFFFFKCMITTYYKGERIQAKTSQWKKHLEKNLNALRSECKASRVLDSEVVEKA